MITDRIKDFSEQPRRLVRRNPQNYRLHSEHQLAALREVLGTMGWIDACVVYEVEEDDDGCRYELIDGEARWSGAGPDETLPLLVLDVDAAEATELLLAMDPVAQMADQDHAMLADLLQGTSMGGTTGVDELLRDMRFTAGIATDEDFAAGQIAPDTGNPTVEAAHPPPDQYAAGDSKVFNLVLDTEQHELFQFWEENWQGSGGHTDMLCELLEQWEAEA